MNCPRVMKGVRARQMRDSYQQKTKPMIRPPNMAKNASVYGPRDSELAPLIREVS